jgi:pimeloyl-ACP methyl ester carboxylesterase
MDMICPPVGLEPVHPTTSQFMADHSARAARVGEQYGRAHALGPDDSGSGTPTNSTVIRRKRLAALLPQLGDTSVAETIVDTVGTDLPNEYPDALAKLGPKSMAALGNWDFRAAARGVTAPVLIVRGSEDNIPLAGCVDWLGVPPNARLLRIAGAGHYPFYECPAQFFAAVGEFLDGNWPAESDERPPR